MAKMFNRARMTVTSTGTGALSLGVAVAGYQTFSSAGAQNGDSVSYAVEDGLKWEIGTGTYNSVAGTLSRTVTQSFDGTTYGTSAISVTTSAQVFISPLAADLQYGTSAGNLVQLDGSAKIPAVDGSQLTNLNAANIASGTLGVARGGTGLTSLTAGYIPFGGSTTYSSDSNLFWDNTNKRLGVGNSSPGFKLSIAGTSGSSATPDTIDLGTSYSNAAGQNAKLRVYYNSSNGAYYGLGVSNNQLDYITGAGSSHVWYIGTSGSELMRLDSSGNLGLGVTPSAWNSSTKALQLLNGWGSLAANNANGNFEIAANAYLNASNNWTYVNAFGAARYTINNSANGSHVWYNYSGTPSAGGTVTFNPSMTLDASGRLGIGKSPSYFVDILGPTVASGAASNTLSVAASSAQTGISTYYNSVRALLQNTNSTSGTMAHVAFATANNNDYAAIIGTCTTHTQGAAVGYLSFATTDGGAAATERARITSDGSLLVGTQSGTGRLVVQQSDAGNPGARIYLSSSTFGDNGVMVTADRNTTNNSFYFISAYNNTAAAYKFRVADSGNVTNTNNSYGAISDISIKENIIDATPKLNDLLSVKVKNFNFVGDSTKQIGVIAQELEEVFPALVETSTQDGIKSVKYSVFTPMLIKAIQELAAKVQALEAKVA